MVVSSWTPRDRGRVHDDDGARRSVDRWLKKTSNILYPMMVWTHARPPVCCVSLASSASRDLQHTSSPRENPEIFLLFPTSSRPRIPLLFFFFLLFLDFLPHLSVDREAPLQLILEHGQNGGKAKEIGDEVTGEDPAKSLRSLLSLSAPTKWYLWLFLALICAKDVLSHFELRTLIDSQVNWWPRGYRLICVSETRKIIKRKTSSPEKKFLFSEYERRKKRKGISIT